MPRLIVVLTTHTHERIARCVMSLAGQTRPPDAIVVSCDGDSQAIRDEVARAADFVGRPVLLVTRAHTGVARPAQTRNNAVRAFSEGCSWRDDDRLVFFDGDCVAPRNVLAVHEDALRDFQLSLGWRINLTQTQTAQLCDGHAGLTFVDIADAAQNAEVRLIARTYRRRNIQRVLRLTKPHKPQVLGANFGVIAAVFREINGIDETYTGWGMEDDDFGRRVYAAGGRPALRLRDCVVLHQHHPIRSSLVWKNNEQAHRLDLAFATVCEHGLENPLPQPPLHIEEIGPGAASGGRSKAESSPFFVVGTGRCGSTLLQAMLMSHIDMRMPPETQYFDHLDPVALGFSDPLKPGDTETYLKHALSERAKFFLGAEAGTADAYAAAVRAGLRSARDQFLWICQRMTQGQSGARLGEKTPQHWKSIDRIGELFPEACFIHLIRDPRDVVASLLEMDWWGNRSARKAAKYWRNAVDTALLQERRCHGRHLIVRYEDLIDRPEGVLREVCIFLGVPFRHEMLDHRASARRSFGGGEVEYKGLAAKPIDRSRVGRYRKRLSPMQVRIIEATVGAHRMRRLGYTPDPAVARPIWSPMEPVFVRVAESVIPGPRSGRSSRSGPPR
jgi:hypothetical protein